MKTVKLLPLPRKVVTSWRAMPTQFMTPTGPNINGLYPAMLSDVLSRGERVSPRGEVTLEIRPLMFRLTNPANRLITIKARRLNRAFAMIEALQLIDGSTNAEQLRRYNSNMIHWVDPVSGQLEAPYGVLIGDQLPDMIELLRRDPDTRQAVLTIYDGKEHFRDMLSTPCTCTLQFFVRGGKLELTTYMRSNDLWWGLPYDVFQFTVLQEAVSVAIGLPMGEYTHIAGSGHLYEPFFDAARDLIRSGSISGWVDIQEPLFPGWSYSEIKRRVSRILNLELVIADGSVDVDEVLNGESGKTREYLQLLVNHLEGSQ